MNTEERFNDLCTISCLAIGKRATAYPGQVPGSGDLVLFFPDRSYLLRIAVGSHFFLLPFRQLASQLSVTRVSLSPKPAHFKASHLAYTIGLSQTIRLQSFFFCSESHVLTDFPTESVRMVVQILISVNVHHCL